MPTRHRSHQIESRSIEIFARSLPETWVLRRKDNDYGVDLEVEVLDARGAATGLLFYVQIKGTDSPAAVKRVQIKTDTLDYLHSLQVPSIIVRCCVPTREIWWAWTESIQLPVGSDAARPVVSFNRVWDSASIREIELILRRRRVIRNLDPRAKLRLKVISDVSHKNRMKVEHAIDELEKSLPFLSRGKEAAPLDVALEIVACQATSS